jgi:hypothetical protein
LSARGVSDLLALGDGHGLSGFPITSQAPRFISDIQAAKLDQFDRFSISQVVFQDSKKVSTISALFRWKKPAVQ